MPTASGICARLAELQRIYPARLLEATLEIARRLHFSLDELRYQYPHELVPSGYTPASWLRHRTLQGLRERWPAGASAAIRSLVEHELELIGELRYEALLPDGGRHRPVCAQPGHPLPGPWLGGQFRGVLLPGDYRGGSGAHVAAVRALHLPRAQRATRHRRGFRARAPRGGDPVHLLPAMAGSGRH